MTEIVFTPEDSEWRALVIFDSTEGPVVVEIFYTVSEITQVDEGGRGCIVLESVQALTDGCSPVGCNSCDLGDVTLPHRVNCPIVLVPQISVELNGDSYDA